MRPRPRRSSICDGSSLARSRNFMAAAPTRAVSPLHAHVGRLGRIATVSVAAAASRQRASISAHLVEDLLLDLSEVVRAPAPPWPRRSGAARPRACDAPCREAAPPSAPAIDRVRRRPPSSAPSIAPAPAPARSPGACARPARAPRRAAAPAPAPPRAGRAWPRAGRGSSPPRRRRRPARPRRSGARRPRASRRGATSSLSFALRCSSSACRSTSRRVMSRSAFAEERRLARRERPGST